MCDSRVFVIRNFWKNERPTSTESETATEHSYYPKSETETEISELESDQPTETINDHVKNLELSKNEPRNENRMHEYKIKRLQEKIARWTTENGAAGDSRIQLENELSTCKFRNDQLKSDNRRLEIQSKKYKTESQEKQARLENEMLACKARINQLESDNRGLEIQNKKYQAKSQEEQAQLKIELSTYKSRNDQLKSDIRLLESQKKKYQTQAREKQAQLKNYEKILERKKCKLLG